MGESVQNAMGRSWDELDQDVVNAAERMDVDDPEPRQLPTGTLTIARALRQQALDYSYVHERVKAMTRLNKLAFEPQTGVMDLVWRIRLLLDINNGIQVNANHGRLAISDNEIRRQLEVKLPMDLWSAVMERDALMGRPTDLNGIATLVKAKLEILAHNKQAGLGPRVAAVQKVDALSEKLEKMTAMMELLAKSSQQRTRGSAGRGSGPRRDRGGPRDGCYECGGNHYKADCNATQDEIRAFKAKLARSSVSSNYSRLVFSNGRVNKQELAWLVDGGSQITCIRSDHPAADHIQWSASSMRGRAADGQVMLADGEARLTLSFGPELTATTTVYRLQGLDVDAIVGNDVLLAGRGYRIELHESTGHGILHLGGGRRMPVWTPEDSACTTETVLHSLSLYRLGANKNQKTRNPHVRIYRTPVLATLEETDFPGVHKVKVGEAAVAIGEELTQEQQERVRALVRRYREAFANSDDEVGIAQGYHFNIDLLDRNPVTSGKHRKIPHHLREEVTTALLALERQGVIRRSNSPYNSGLVVVRKANGDLRICVDYVELNDKSANDGFELPTVEDQLNILQGSKYFTHLDLARGYHQLLVAPDSRAKTAFSASGIQFEYVVMPFGPKNGPAAFCRLVQKIVKDKLPGEPIAVYIDEFIIGGKGSFDEHLNLVGRVLQALQDHLITIKATKAHVGMREIKCLGFIVSEDGIRPDPEKLEAIRDYPEPGTGLQLKGFLGLINFYGQFVKNLQIMLRPLNRALSGDDGEPYRREHKNRKIEWTPEMRTAFKDTKEAFTAGLEMALPDLSKLFTVTTDASEAGIAGILSQKQADGTHKPIAFFSKALSTVMDVDGPNVKTRELELYAFLHATRKWRSYLYGREFEWFTDHKPLLWDEKDPPKKVLNWLAELKELNFKSHYVKGEENVAADALSRRGDFAPPSRRLAALARDLRVFVPKDGVKQVLRRHHDEAGHRGGRAVMDEICDLYYWPGMRRDVMEWCSSCETCQRVNPKATGEVSTELTTQPSKPFKVVTLDLVKVGNHLVLVIECQFTRYVETAVVASKNAEIVYRQIEKTLFNRHGTPTMIRSDNGTEFNGLAAASQQMGFEWRRSSKNNPQSNGMVERANQSVIREINRLQAEHEMDLERALERGTFLYNIKTHSATGYKPFELLYGRDPEEMREVLDQKPFGRINAKSETARFVAARAETDRKTFADAVAHDQKAKQDRRVELPTERFKVGDRVMAKVASRLKTEPRWRGPLEVLQVLEGGVYRLKDTVKFRAVSEVMHHRLLTAFHARPERLQHPVAVAGPGQEKNEAPADEPHDTGSKSDITEKEIDQPAQPDAEPAASRRSPRTNKGRFIDRIYATVAAVRRVKEKIDYWGRSSRPENQAALSLLLDPWGGGV
jgi:transposase InsO family protein